MKTKEKYVVDNSVSSIGTHYCDEMELDYNKMVRLFGPPTESDGFKISTEWHFVDKQGLVYTVYDYKMTVLYSKSLPSVDEFRSKPRPLSYRRENSINSRPF